MACVERCRLRFSAVTSAYERIAITESRELIVNWKVTRLPRLRFIAWFATKSLLISGRSTARIDHSQTCSDQSTAESRQSSTAHYYK